MKKDYIMDDEKVRQCDKNTSQMNIFEYAYLWIIQWSYFPRMFESIWDCTKGIIEPFFALILNLVVLILTPISVLILATIEINKAKKEMKRHEENRKVRYK